jgi:hypothetical protein
MSDTPSFPAVAAELDLGRVIQQNAAMYTQQRARHHQETTACVTAMRIPIRVLINGKETRAWRVETLSNGLRLIGVYPQGVGEVDQTHSLEILPDAVSENKG